MCSHHLWDQTDTPICTRTDPHETGHVYVSSSSAPDRKRDAEGSLQ